MAKMTVKEILDRIECQHRHLVLFLRNGEKTSIYEDDEVMFLTDDILNRPVKKRTIKTIKYAVNVELEI